MLRAFFRIRKKIYNTFYFSTKLIIHSYFYWEFFFIGGFFFIGALSQGLSCLGLEPPLSSIPEEPLPILFFNDMGWTWWIWSHRIRFSTCDSSLAWCAHMNNMLSSTVTCWIFFSYDQMIKFCLWHVWNVAQCLYILAWHESMTINS